MIRGMVFGALLSVALVAIGVSFTDWEFWVATIIVNVLFNILPKD